MAKPSTLEVCKKDLFAPSNELEERYDAVTAARVLRLRDLYSWKLGAPDSTDREFVLEDMSRYGLSQSAAYNDLDIIKTLLPMLNSANRDYHRWRGNEMLLEAYRMAKKRKDTKTMAAAARDYMKFNGCDREDEVAAPYDEIVPQPFTATDDPSVLGIKPIPNLKDKIRSLIAKYSAETIDIEDVEAEEFDLEEDELFGEPKDEGQEQ